MSSPARAGWIKSPLSPSSITSGIPPTRVATTGSAEGHRLQEGHRQPLAPRGQNEDVRALVELPKGGRPEDSVEAYEGRQTRFANARAQFSLLASELFLAGELEFDRDPFAAKLRDRLHQLGSLLFAARTCRRKGLRQTGP